MQKQKMMRRAALFGLAQLTVLSSAALAVNLAGRIESTDGKPLNGATAFIYSAGVRQGTSPYCPTCYLDCGKTGVADAAGRFEIKGLDASLLFRVIVLAKGHKPAVLARVDPLMGEAIARLDPRPTLPDDPKRVIRARVVDEYDEPVVGATIEVAERELDGGVTTGRPEGIDLVTFSDEHGEIAIVADDPILNVSLLVEARSLARHKFCHVRPAEQSFDLRLTRGHAFTGRVVRDGQPVANAVVGLVQTNRSFDYNFVGEYTAVTDRDGSYHFSTAPPNDDYCIYGKMASIGPLGGAIAEVSLKSGDDGAVTTVDDLQIGAAHSLRGRVVLSDDKPVPADTRLLVSRERAWDSQIVPLDADGSFRVDGLPGEACSLSVQVPGYRMSTLNRSLDRLNPYMLVGLVDGDVGDLKVLLEPGQPEDVWSLSSAQQQAIIKARNKLQTMRLTGAQ